MLIESVHPSQFDVLGPLFPAPRDDDAPELAKMREFWTSGWKHTTSTTERIDFRRSFGQAPEAHALDGLPARVLTAGSFSRMPFIPRAARETMQSSWLDLQKRLLDLTDGAIRSHWSGSGHFLQRENHHAIVAAILDPVMIESPLSVPTSS